MNGIVSRGAALGAAAGTFPGAVMGTLLGGALGAAFGALAGAMWGAVFGTVGGLTLALLHRPLLHGRGGGRGWSRLVAAFTSTGCAIGTEMIYVGFAAHHRAVAVGFVVVCAAMGALVGPATLLGLRPLALGRHNRPWQDVATRLLVVSIVAFAGAGAVVGCVLGLGYVQTVVVAAIEGAVIGSGAGVALWALAALVLFAPRLRANR